MSTDYSVLIDKETWAFIDRTNSFYPPNAIDLTIEEQRGVYNTMCRAFFAGYPEAVSSMDAFIDARDHRIPVRVYDKSGSEPEAVCLYFHGGGFVVGGLDSHDDVCAEICDATGFRIISVDYRLAPEHLHPTAFRDCLAAFEHVAETSDLPIIICGDSAGGNLAAAVTHHVRRHDRAPIGQVLIYPGLGGATDQGSYLTHAEAPMLSTRDTVYYANMRGGGFNWSADPRFAPLNDPDFGGLPPTVVISAECDPLSDDGRHYRDKILAAGGKAIWNNEPGLIHAYLRARHSVERARSSFRRIVTAVHLLGQGRWPGQL
ncbi:alpha/beta hydrolase [Phyllobacterium pellucidum]|uniref:alpha/beta hydrolase n=1 Tax=Phyllobacterium pellucidum TaxID=2740464 RepID=UPI001D151CCA|nr:alpha/beta hydrolase [Phyllobacterium sp. T1018]UGY08434.1 alpha/beta hydrolase [Phyllobacterium sp. T1018]